MKKTFCFLCHKRTNSLSMMVDYFARKSSNVIIIHVDAKANINDFDEIKQKNNVTLLNERHKVTWGGVEMVSASISLIKEALTTDFDYLFLLSGDDLACMDESRLDDKLNSINLANLIHFQDDRNNFVNPDDRVMYKYPSFLLKKKNSALNFISWRIFNLFKKLRTNTAYFDFISSGGRFYKGSQWFGLNFKTATNVVNFLNANQWYIDMYRESLIPDEIFFHTLIKYIGINDIYTDKTKPSDALRYTDWNTGPDYPRTLDFSDIIKIKDSGCLFARKFGQDATSKIFRELLD